LFGPYLWARGAAYLGFWAFAVVSAIVMFEATGSVTMVGLITAAQFLPQFVGTPISGVLADRGHVATQIVTGFVLTGSGAGLLGVWLLAAGGADGLDGPVPVLVASSVVGLGFAVGSSSTSAVLATMVRPDELGTAIALNSAPLMGARAIGPALAGGILVVAGPAAACLVAAALNLGCAAVMAWLRLPQRLAQDTGRTTSLRAGVGHVWRDRPLLLVLLGAAAIGIGAEPGVTLAPALADRLGEVRAAGWIASAFGLGGVVGLAILGPVRHRLSLRAGAGAGLLLMAGGLALVAPATAVVSVLSGMVVCGVGMTVAHANNSTLLQVMTPDHLRGRVTSLWFLCWLGARPVGAAGIGGLADRWGAVAALVGTASVVAAVAAACWWVWRTAVRE
jgi:MFS family permease